MIILKMCFSVNQIDDLQSSNKKQSWTFLFPWFANNGFQLGQKYFGLSQVFLVDTISLIDAWIKLQKAYRPQLPSKNLPINQKTFDFFPGATSILKGATFNIYSSLKYIFKNVRLLYIIVLNFVSLLQGATFIQGAMLIILVISSRNYDYSRGYL